MFVLAEHCRGRGVGSAVLRALHPHRVVTLSVFKINPAALRFYERLGWQVVSQDDIFHDLRRPAQPADEHAQ